MTDLNTLGLPAINAILSTDEIRIVQDVATTPEDRRATIEQIYDYLFDRFLATLTANDFNVAAQVVSIDYANAQKASASQPGLLTEMAIASEVDTSTDATRAISPDALAGSNFGERVVVFSLNGGAALTTADLAMFKVPSSMHTMNLVEVSGHCGLNNTSGSPTGAGIVISVQNNTVNMLSTNITIDQNEFDTENAATPAVIDTNEDDIVTGNSITVEVVSTGTGVTYMQIVLIFRMP